MDFITATRSELLKTKRTASFWLSVAGAALIPVLFFVAYVSKSETASAGMKANPWVSHFSTGWELMSPLLFPMYIILICTLVTHIEFRNNTWKQVFAAPVSTGTIYLSKFLAIHLMMLLCFILFNVFMLLSGLAINLVRPDFTFLNHPVDWKFMFHLNVKMYVSILGISGLMYWAALRFKNFIAPLGIGLALLTVSLIALSYKWEYVALLPFAQPHLTLESAGKAGAFFPTAAVNSLLSCVAFTALGWADLRFRKEKG